MSDKLYHIIPTLYTEVRSGSVWLYEDKSLSGTRLIKIKNVSNSKTIVVSYRRIDSNFNAVYKKQKDKKQKDKKKETKNLPKGALLIEEYYREKLEIKSNEIKHLNISPANTPFDYIRYLTEHPNDSVSITTRLAIISIVIGIISIILSTHILAYIVYMIQEMLS